MGLATNTRPVLILDCTFRDGGYYNSWNFSKEIIQEYLYAMDAAGVHIVELGLRSLKNKGFNGACAYTTDDFLRGFTIPSSLTVGVMINGAELVGVDQSAVLAQLFPEPASSSPVKLVRVACHVHEFAEALPASLWLKERGFDVGFNLMQVAERSQAEIEALSLEATKWPLAALYFADSLGSMKPDQASQIIHWLRRYWQGSIGIHTHDNMGLALQNTLRAIEEGCNWLDVTITGMGRGPGNAKTEQLVLELESRNSRPVNLVPLMNIIRTYFKPMQHRCGWGTNTYYYLAGKYGIHPTYIQEMLGDSRYSDEDILAVIQHLRIEGGKQFSFNTLDSARHFYKGEPRGTWSPAAVMSARTVLLLGTGSGVADHREALERFIIRTKPYVIALNTQSQIAANLIDARVACHPVRLLADCKLHAELPQPLITPASMLPDDVKDALQGNELLDFGLCVQQDKFEFHSSSCTLPTSLVIAYALAVVTSGKAKAILMAGFDGYGADDPRNAEMNRLLKTYFDSPESLSVQAITPTRYDLPSKSVYGSC